MSVEELLDLLRGRRSVRAFSGEPVTDEEIRILVEAARHAPSNGNRQPWRFVAVRNAGIRAAVGEAIRGAVERTASRIGDADLAASFRGYARYFLFVAGAPVLVFVLYKKTPPVVASLLAAPGHPQDPGLPPAELISASLAAGNLLLAAHARGLGACLTTGPLIAAEEIGRILGIRPPYGIAAVVPVGRPAERPPDPGRKPVDRVLEVLA